MDKISSRRGFLKAIGIAGAVVSSRFVGAASTTPACSTTKRQTSGPFLPDDFPVEISDDPSTVHPPFVRVLDSNADLTVVDDLKNPGAPRGQIIVVRGVVQNEKCGPVAKARVYMWQADDDGQYNQQGDTHFGGADKIDPNFQYRGEVDTNADGTFEFKTILPKYYPIGSNLFRTAHLHFAVHHPTYLPLVTQTYFEGEALKDIANIRKFNKTDIILTRNGKILYPETIYEFKDDPSVPAGPVGNVVLNVKTAPTVR